MKEIEVDKFKNLILKMHRGFPNYIFSGVESMIITEDIRNNLIQNGFLIKEVNRDMDGKQHPGYMLGPNSLTLVSSWMNEKIARQVRNLNIILIALTLVLISMTVATIL